MKTCRTAIIPTVLLGLTAGSFQYEQKVRRWKSLLSEVSLDFCKMCSFCLSRMHFLFVWFYVLIPFGKGPPSLIVTGLVQHYSQDAVIFPGQELMSMWPRQPKWALFPGGEKWGEDVVGAELSICDVETFSLSLSSDCPKLCFGYWPLKSLVYQVFHQVYDPITFASN